MRRTVTLDLDDRVQEPRLLLEAHRLGRVRRGRANESQSGLGKQLDRSFEVFAPVPQVGAQGQEASDHRVS